MDFARVRKIAPGGIFRAADIIGKFCRDAEIFAG
jgi:hypothetical protein